MEMWLILAVFGEISCRIYFSALNSCSRSSSNRKNAARVKKKRISSTRKRIRSLSASARVLSQLPSQIRRRSLSASARISSQLPSQLRVRSLSASARVSSHLEKCLIGTGSETRSTLVDYNEQISTIFEEYEKYARNKEWKYFHQDYTDSDDSVDEDWEDNQDLDEPGLDDDDKENRGQSKKAFSSCVDALRQLVGIRVLQRDRKYRSYENVTTPPAAAPMVDTSLVSKPHVRIVKRLLLEPEIQEIVKQRGQAIKMVTAAPGMRLSCKTIAPGEVRLTVEGNSMRNLKLQFVHSLVHANVKDHGEEFDAAYREALADLKNIEDSHTAYNNSKATIVNLIEECIVREGQEKLLRRPKFVSFKNFYQLLGVPWTATSFREVEEFTRTGAEVVEGVASLLRGLTSVEVKSCQQTLLAHFISGRYKHLWRGFCALETIRCWL